MRTRQRWTGRVVAALASGLLAGGASGQSVLFVTADRAEAGVGESIGLSALRIDGAGAAAASAWPAERISWMFVRAGGGQMNYEPGTPRAVAGKPGPEVAIEALDAAMIGVDLAPQDEEIGGAALMAWARANIEAKLLPKGLDGIAANDKVVVRRVESIKVIVRGRGPGEQMRGNRPVRSATATDKSGQAVEIRPMLDPTSVVTPTDMPLRLYSFHEGAKFAQMRMVHVPSGDDRRVSCNDKGIAWIRIDKPGEYRVSFHAMAPFTPGPDEDSKAAWALHSATCTFVVPAQPGQDVNAEPGQPKAPANDQSGGQKETSR